jgi:hypothetical protein
MKISGQVGADTLDVSGAQPKSTCLIFFQDTGNGRITVADLTVDDTGNAKLATPYLVQWGSGHKIMVQPLGGGASAVAVHLYNTTDIDGTVTATDEAPASGSADQPRRDNAQQDDNAGRTAGIVEEQMHV